MSPPEVSGRVGRMRTRKTRRQQIGAIREGEAQERVARILFLSVGVAGAVYSVLGFPKASAQLADLEPWWAYTTYAMATAAPVILGIATTFASTRVLRAIATAFAGVFLVTMATWRLFMTTPHEPGGLSPWPNDVITIAAVAVAISRPRREVWMYVGTSTLLAGMIRYLADPELGVGLAAMDMLYALLTNTVFAALTLVAREGAEHLDRTAERARIVASAEAEASARVQERIRIDALAHDHVLSALLIASREGPVPREKLRELARLSHATLTEPVPTDSETLPVEDFAAMLRSAITSQSDGITVIMSMGGTLDVPVDAAHALLESTGEALRNSLRHASRPPGKHGETRPVKRAVSVTCTDRSVTIDITDDGRGFSPRRVSPERLGVRVSILERMNSIPGGVATVEGYPGTGTKVRLGVDMTAVPCKSSDASREKTAADNHAATPNNRTGFEGGDPLLQVSGLGTYAIFLLFASVHLALTIFSIGGYRSTSLAFFALIAIIGAGFIVSVNGPARLSRGPTATVVLLCAGASLNVWNLPSSGWPGWASWVWGAVTFVLFMLTLRRRTGAAWVAFALMTGLTILWCLLVGRGPLAGVGFVIRSAALLFVVSLFARLIERTRLSIGRLQRTALSRAVSQAAAEATMDEQITRLARLRAQATPALHRILSDDDLTADDFRYFALVEGALRDQLRASELARPAVADAARRARSRGVDVSLMNDRIPGTLPDEDWEQVETAVVDQLDSASSGSVTVRLLPQGRENLATIVVDNKSDSVRRTVENPHSH